MNNSTNDLEETSITYMNYQTLCQIFKCVQVYFKKYLPHLYLTHSVDDVDKDGELSAEVLTECDPLFDIVLN